MKISFHIGSHLRDLFAGRRDPENMQALMHIYWGTLLVLSPLILLCVGTFSWLSLSSGETGPAIAASSSGAAEAVIQKQLHVFVGGFTARQMRFDAARANPVSIADPDPVSAHVKSPQSGASPAPTGGFLILPPQ